MIGLAHSLGGDDFLRQPLVELRLEENLLGVFHFTGTIRCHDPECHCRTSRHARCTVLACLSALCCTYPNKEARGPHSSNSFEPFHSLSYVFSLMLVPRNRFSRGVLALNVPETTLRSIWRCLATALLQADLSSTHQSTILNCLYDRRLLLPNCTRFIVLIQNPMYGIRR